jgi:hypothetical protein
MSMNRFDWAGSSCLGFVFPSVLVEVLSRVLGKRRDPSLLNGFRSDRTVVSRNRADDETHFLLRIVLGHRRPLLVATAIIITTESVVAILILLKAFNVI